MFLFNRKIALHKSGIFKEFTDWHCHILPGVDDGVQTMKEALELLNEYETLGVGVIWLTPHIMEDIPNTTALLKQRFAELQTAYTGKIKLHLAAENMLDNLFEERLNTDDVLPLGENGDCLLVETSYFNPPMGMFDMLEHVKTKGYHPMLAHPERYVYMNESDYHKLKSMGIKFQLNLFSLVGAYGKTAKNKAEWMLKHRFYNLTGSDTHRLEHFKNMTSLPISKNVVGDIPKNVYV